MNTSAFRIQETRAGRYLRSLLAPRRPTETPPAAPLEPHPENVAVPLPEPRYKILVVDDDPITLRTLSTKLKAGGYAVVTAPDSATAIGAVRDEQPDLALLDITFEPDVASGGMVAWDGFQLMTWLKGMAEARGMPFIMISQSEAAVYEQRSLSMGAVAFFQKPIPHAELLQLIAKTLEERALAADQQAA